MTMICATCKVRIVRATIGGGYVHDATLAELRVTPEEVQAVHLNAIANEPLERGDRRYNALHQPKLARAVPVEAKLAQ